MIVRDVFQCKYGRGDDLLALFREMQGMMPMPAGSRVMTDASGPFFTIVSEFPVTDFAAWQKMNAEEMANESFADWFRRMMEVVESGRREFWNVELQV